MFGLDRAIVLLQAYVVSGVPCINLEVTLAGDPIRFMRSLEMFGYYRDTPVSQNYPPFPKVSQTR
jgi:hypothetical protein